MSAIVILVRHGHHEEIGIRLSGRSQIALDPRGRFEAERLAEALAGTRLCAVTSSPRPRCVETAAIISNVHGLPVDCDQALEEIDFGEWTGRCFADLADDPRWQTWNEHRARGCAQGGETMQHAAGRIVDHLVTYRGRDGTFVCVTHGDLIRAAICCVSGRSLDDLLSFDIATGTLSRFQVDAAGKTSLLSAGYDA